MSSVRMCDKCGAIFSERADGWQTFTATTIVKVRDQNGRRYTRPEVESLDACPSCAIGVIRDEETEVVPRLVGGSAAIVNSGDVA